MELSPEISEIFEKLNKNGFEANLVGGYVRDYIIGKEANDIDICTNAKPQEIMKIFNRVVPIGIEYGTVHVLIEDKDIEVTTYREDGIYKDGRRPESVRFVANLDEDLKRRDFTINAMAYNPRDGIIDKFGGKKDIENKIIRTVGDPNKCFEEDAIRILRAVRFASKLGFSIEENTLKAICDNKDLISKVSNDRIRKELDGIFMSDNIEIGVKYLVSTELYNLIFERLYYTYEEQIKIILKRIKKLDLIDISEEERLKVVLSVLLCKQENIDFSIEYAYRFLKKYNYPNSISKDVLKIIKYISMMPNNIKDVNNQLVRKQISKLSNLYSLYLEVMKVIFYDTNNGCVEAVIERVKKIDNNNTVYKRSNLAINGNDLIELGMQRGRAISVALDELLNIVLDNPSLNTREYLIQYIEKKGINSYVKMDPFVKIKENAAQRLRSEIVLNKRLIHESETLDKEIKNDIQ